MATHWKDIPQDVLALLRRGTQRVRIYQGQVASAPDRDHPYGIDIAAFLAAGDDLAARIERQGLTGIPPADLRPPLITAGS